MKADKASNASTLEPTSTTARPSGETALTEAEFLQREAADAKAAAMRALGDLKSELGAGIDPRGWVEDHPWWTLGSVAAASFVAATVAVPSKEQQALRKLAAIESAMHRSENRPAEHNGHGETKAERSLLAMALMELLAIFKPFLGELMANIVRPPQSQEPEQRAEQR